MSSTLKQYINKRKIIFFAWSINTICIVLFFALTIEGKRIYLYPALISFFILCIVGVVDFIEFKSFKESISDVTKNALYTANASKAFDSYVLDSISSIHNKYIKEMSDLNEVNKLKNIFFSKWVHEMKTPITVMGLIIEKLSKDSLLVNELKELSVEKDKLLKYVDDSLNFIRLDQFSTDYKPQKVYLDNLVKDVINENKRSFIYNKVFPKIEVKDESIEVLTDYKWCKFIISQVISNAVKYTMLNDKSDKIIVFSIKKQDDRAVLSIKDTGLGIAKHDMHRIFSPFFTGDHGKQTIRSTGMGLYLCKKIADKLNHEIMISSEVSKGTEVVIIF